MKYLAQIKSGPRIRYIQKHSGEKNGVETLTNHLGGNMVRSLLIGLKRKSILVKDINTKYENIKI